MCWYAISGITQVKICWFISYSHAPIPFLLNIDIYNKPFQCEYILWLIFFFSLSSLMIFERSVQPCTDCSNKNYTKEEYTLAIDYSQRPIVYHGGASGSKNYICHCVAWPTLSRDILIIWKNPWPGYKEQTRNRNLYVFISVFITKKDKMENTGQGP